MAHDTDQTGDQNGGVFNLIGAGKDTVALLRDLALFVLALLLVVFPGKFNDVLTKAGFEQGSLVGFTWKSQLVESDNALKEARTTIADLKAQLDKTAKALNEAQAKLNDPSLNATVAKLDAENNKLREASIKVEASISNTIASSASLVEKAQTALVSNPVWGVVYSGDATLDSARYEVTSVATLYGIPNAAVYLRQNSFRAVSVLENRTQAEQVLAKAKQRRNDAYIVNLPTWCPSPAEKNGYRECRDQ
jgi:hypothetical protein